MKFTASELSLLGEKSTEQMIKEACPANADMGAPGAETRLERMEKRRGEKHPSSGRGDPSTEALSPLDEFSHSHPTASKTVARPGVWVLMFTTLLHFLLLNSVFKATERILVMVLIPSSETRETPSNSGL